jgi:hypothetical protein
MDIVTLTVLPEGRYDTARRKNTIAPKVSWRNEPLGDQSPPSLKGL